MALRRCLTTLVTSRRPAAVRLNVMFRRSVGDSRRSSQPALIRRSQMRLAFDGLTSRPAAIAARFSGPLISTMTSTRHCGTVTLSSTAAMEAAAMPTNARDARNTASIWSAEGPSVRAGRRCMVLITKSSLNADGGPEQRRSIHSESMADVAGGNVCAIATGQHVAYTLPDGGREAIAGVAVSRWARSRDVVFRRVPQLYTVPTLSRSPMMKTSASSPADGASRDIGKTPRLISRLRRT